MDQNKVKKLTEIGYSITPACGLCEHASFPVNDWGTCGLHTYDHLKHNGTHQLSIHKLGSCPDFKEKPESVNTMMHFRPFFKLT